MLKKIPNNNQTRNKIYISKKCHAPGLKRLSTEKNYLISTNRKAGLLIFLSKSHQEHFWKYRQDYATKELCLLIYLGKEGESSKIYKLLSSLL